MRLTERQEIVIKKLASGSNVKTVAQEMRIHPKTVDYHRSVAMRKLGLKSIVELAHFGIARLGVPLLFAMILAVGCQPKPAPKPQVAAFAAIRGKVRVATVQEVVSLPTRQYGPAWDYGEIPDGLTFEVWSSTNLTDWVLRTNTVEKSVVFSQVPKEFYKVRANLNGIVSDWASTR